MRAMLQAVERADRAAAQGTNPPVGTRTLPPPVIPLPPAPGTLPGRRRPIRLLIGAIIASLVIGSVVFVLTRPVQTPGGTVAGPQALATTTGGAPAAEGWVVDPVVVHNTGSKFDLVLEVTPRPATGTYSLVLEYDRVMFSPETVRRWLDHFARLLDAACLDPKRTLAELPLMGRDEEEEIRSHFGQMRQHHPDVPCLQ